MATDVRAEPAELVRLAATTLAAARGMSDGWRDGQRELAPPGSAFGDTPSATRAASAHRAVLAGASTALDRLVAVHEGDVDRLYRVAFAYQQADRDAATRQRVPLRGLA
jgi:hypothetical protein